MTGSGEPRERLDVLKVGRHRRDGAHGRAGLHGGPLPSLRAAASPIIRAM